MQREILFRGKRIDNGEWVYGDLITKPVHHECVILENGVINHSVDPTTIGQKTPIKARNGDSIFESDIIQTVQDSIFQIIWNDEHAAFAIVNKHGDFFDIKQYYSTNIWIIGNRFDNPDLFRQF